MKIGEKLSISSRWYSLLSRESTACLTFFLWLSENKYLPRWSNNVVVINDEVELWLEGDGEGIFGDYMKHISRLAKANAINVLDWDKGVIMINPNIQFNGSPKERILVIEKWNSLKDKNK
jgi:hypothetical protein